LRYERPTRRCQQRVRDLPSASGPGANDRIRVISKTDRLAELA
jgi:hypothetical protein